MNARRLLLAGTTAAVLAAAPGTALADPQIIGGTVIDVVTLTPPGAATLGNLSPGSATPATGTTSFTVVANRCYDLTVADAAGGLLKFAANQFTQKLQWKLTAAADSTYNELDASADNIAAGAAATPLLGTTHNVTYRQRLSGELVPSGAYSLTATVTAAPQTCA